MKLSSLCVSSGLVVLLGLSNSIQATLVEAKSFQDLTLEAEMTAIGRVVTVESHPTVDLQYAYTYVTVGELELLKGNYRQPTITLRMDGGPLGDDTTLAIPGIPHFRSGEKVVLFIKGNGHHICPLVGWEQGVLRVETDKPLGREILKTSNGQRIQTIKKGEFVISSAADRNQTDSAGVPDNGEVKNLNLTPLPGTAVTAGLTLESFKQQVQKVLIEAGPQGLSNVEVTSADLKLDSPGLRTNKQPN